jgi:hypothetical protein
MTHHDGSLMVCAWERVCIYYRIVSLTPSTPVLSLQLLPQALTDADFGPESIQMGDTGLTLARVGVAHVCVSSGLLSTGRMQCDMREPGLHEFLLSD